MIRGIAFFASSTLLLTVFSIALALAIPAYADSRDVLVITVFAAGIGFGLLAGFDTHRTLRTAVA